MFCKVCTNEMNKHSREDLMTCMKKHVPDFKDNRDSALVFAYNAGLIWKSGDSRPGDKAIAVYPGARDSKNRDFDAKVVEDVPRWVAYQSLAIKEKSVEPEPEKDAERKSTPKTVAKRD